MDRRAARRLARDTLADAARALAENERQDLGAVDARRLAQAYRDLAERLDTRTAAGRHATPQSVDPDQIPLFDSPEGHP